MEIATLTATLELRVAQMQANAMMADALLEGLQRQMKDSAKAAVEFGTVLNQIKLSERNVTDTVAGTEAIRKGLKGDEDQAAKTKLAMGEMKLGGTAGVIADAALQKRALKELEEQAIRTRMAEALAGSQGTGVLRGFTAPGGSGHFEPGAAQAEPFLPPKRGFYQPPQRGFVGGAPASASIIGAGDRAYYDKPIGPLTEADADLKRRAAMAERAASQFAVEQEALRYYKSQLGPKLDAQRDALGRIAMPAARQHLGVDPFQYAEPAGPQLMTPAERRGFESQLLSVRRAAGQARYFETLTETRGFGGGAMMKDPSGRFTREVPFGRQFYFDDEGRYLPTGGRISKDADLSQIGNRRAGVAAAERYLRDHEGRGGDRGGGGGGDRDGHRGGLFDEGGIFGSRGFFAGVLPGGRRAGPAAVLTGIGLLGAATPALLPAAGGLAVGGAAAITSLVGVAGTLKLAFADITAAAFTSRKAFDALNPVQQKFVQTLRSLDAGLGHTLEGIAQKTVLPGLTSALHEAFTPALTGTLTRGVGAFGGAISGGAQQFGSLLGSSQFNAALGPMLQADSRYARDFFTEITNLVDAFVHLSAAAVPFTNWLSSQGVHLTAWIDSTVKAGEATGKLAQFFDHARGALSSLGGLVKSMGQVLGAFGNIFTFEGAISTVNTFTRVFQILAGLLNANRDVLHQFFAGALQAANDLLTAIQQITRAIHPLLRALQGVVNAVGGWRVVFDGFLAFFAARVVVSMLVGLTSIVAEVAAIGTAADAASIRALGLRGALVALGSAPVMAALLAVAAVLAEIHGLSGTDTKVGATGTTAGLPSATSKFQGKPSVTIGAGGGYSITYDRATGKYSENFSRGPFLSPPKPVSVEAAAARLGVSVRDLRAAVAAQTDTPAQAKARAAAAASAGGVGLFDTSGQFQSQLTTTVQTSLIGTSAFDTPHEFAGDAKTDVLPYAIRRQIALASTTTSTKDDVAAARSGIAWIKSHLSGFKKQDQVTALQEEGSLLSSITTAQNKNKVPARSGLGFLSQGMQDKLSAVQQAAQGVGITGTSESALRAAGTSAVNAQLDSLKALAGVEAEAYGTLLKEHATAKEMKGLIAERLSMSKELARTLKDLAAISTGEAKVQAQDKFDKQVNQMLGIGPNSGIPSVTQLRSRERNMLEAEAKRAHVVVPGGLSVEGMIKNLQSQGIDIPKKTLESLHLINKVLDKSLDENKKLSSEAKANISARLSEINNTLKHTLHPSNYRVPNENKLLEMAGLGWLKGQARRRAGEGLAEVAEHFGKIPTGPAAGGVPLGPDGKPLHAGSHPSHVTPAHHVVSHHSTRALEMATHGPLASIERAFHFVLHGGNSSQRNAFDEYQYQISHKGGLPGTEAASIAESLAYHPYKKSSYEGMGARESVTINGDIHINVEGAHVKNPAELAHIIRGELVKGARRNPTQTRGPSAGVNRGLN